MEALGLALVGRAMLSKILIQSSTEGWCWAPGLFVVWPKATQFWGLLDFMAWLIMISKRAYTKCPLPGMLLLVPPSPQRAAANPHLHRRPSNTKVSLVQSLGQGVGGGGHCCFPLGLGAHKILFVCASQEFSLCFPPVLWKSYNQIPLAFKVRFPGNSQFLCRIFKLRSLTWGSEPSE